MASSSEQTKIHALSVKKYQSSKKCNDCNEERAPGFSWLVVTCGCGCGEKKRTCENCPAGAPPTCNGIKYKRMNKDCTTQ